MSGERADALEDCAEGRRGAQQRQVADLKMPNPDVHHGAEGSRTDVGRCGACRKLGRQRVGGNRQEPAQEIEGSGVRAAVIEHPEQSRPAVKPAPPSLLDKPRDRRDIEAAHNLGEVELGREVIVGEVVDLLHRVPTALSVRKTATSCRVSVRTAW